MSISKEQWLNVRENLEHKLCEVIFTIREREIKVIRQRLRDNSMGWLVLVDDQLLEPGAGDSSSINYDPITGDVWAECLDTSIGLSQQPQGICRVPMFYSACDLINQYKKLDGLELVKIGTQEVV